MSETPFPCMCQRKPKAELDDGIHSTGKLESLAFCTLTPFRRRAPQIVSQRINSMSSETQPSSALSPQAGPSWDRSQIANPLIISSCPSDVHLWIQTLDRPGNLPRARFARAAYSRRDRSQALAIESFLESVADKRDQYNGEDDVEVRGSWESTIRNLARRSKLAIDIHTGEDTYRRAVNKDKYHLIDARMTRFPPRPTQPTCGSSAISATIAPFTKHQERMDSDLVTDLPNVSDNLEKGRCVET